MENEERGLMMETVLTIELDHLDIFSLLVIFVCSVGTAYFRGKLIGIREISKAYRKIIDPEPIETNEIQKD
jgi:hypothetical protein